MKVSIVANILETDCVANPGDEMDLREEVALDLIARGLAIKVSDGEKEKTTEEEKKK